MCVGRELTVPHLCDAAHLIQSGPEGNGKEIRLFLEKLDAP